YQPESSTKSICQIIGPERKAPETLPKRVVLKRFTVNRKFDGEVVMKRTSALVLALVLTLLFASALFAQKTTGAITGTVDDPSGAAMVGASVTATNIATGAVRNATTDEQGNYTFPDLTPGTYTIGVKVTGFREYKQNNVVLNVASTRRADVKMTP